MNAERTVATLLNQIRDELLPHPSRTPSEIQTSREFATDLRSLLHSLHYYCIRAHKFLIRFAAV